MNIIKKIRVEVAVILVDPVISDKKKKETKGRRPAGIMVDIVVDMLSAILSCWGRMRESQRRIKSTFFYHSLGNCGMCSKFAEGASRGRSDASI